MKKLLYTTLFAALLTANAAVASSDKVDLQEVKEFIIDAKLPTCKYPETDFDAVYCYGKIYVVADDVLNTAYQDAKQSLSIAHQAKLRGAQTAWRISRDKACITLQDDQEVLNLVCAFEATLGSTWFLFELEKNPSKVDSILGDYYAFIDDI